MKYQLPFDAEVKLHIPEGAEYLCVQTQFNKPHLWVSANPGNPPVEKGFCIRGTGQPFKGNEGKYTSSFQLDGGKFVFHVFEHSDDGGYKEARVIL